MRARPRALIVAERFRLAERMRLARLESDRRFVHAYPSVENGPSNAICRKLGFTLLEEHEFEWPPDSGTFMRCNDWRFDLFADG